MAHRKEMTICVLAAALSSAIGFSGCWTVKSELPGTLAETHTSYSYIPLDPLPVEITPANDCYTGDPKDGKLTGTLKGLLESLPDQAVRVAIGQYNASGTLVYGPAKVGLSGQSYQVVLDYVSVDTRNVEVYIQRVLNASHTEVSVFDDSIKAQTTYKVFRDPQGIAFAFEQTSRSTPSGELVVVPVYVGVGLRLTASVTVTKANANLSSLGAIAANAESGKLVGTLTVQTLGVTGKSVATSLPLPSELNQTTIQNAILALGSIKAVLYDPNTEVDPRVVGIYNPVGGGQQVVNGIISVLASNPIRWFRPCAAANRPSP